jgi:hypothetical protein
MDKEIPCGYYFKLEGTYIYLILASWHQSGYRYKLWREDDPYFFRSDRLGLVAFDNYTPLRFLYG